MVILAVANARPVAQNMSLKTPKPSRKRPREKMACNGNQRCQGNQSHPGGLMEKYPDVQFSDYQHQALYFQKQPFVSSPF